MRNKNKYLGRKLKPALLLLMLIVFAYTENFAQQPFSNSFQSTESSKPWVFWYWMKASASKAGITADLEAMKQAGIGGAYLMFIKDTPAVVQPAARQLSPLWWDMVKFAMRESKRLDLQLGMHVSDGFALAGGPWITPEMSMQKVVSSKTFIQGGESINKVLQQPETNEGYYKDIAVYAYPTINSATINSYNNNPTVSCSLPGIDASILAKEYNKETFRASDSCWIQYAFDKPFTCRSILIKTNGNNYQAQRLVVLSSNDGIHFELVDSLQAPRHGWQDVDEQHSYAITPSTAKYFRFVYNKQGSEPGSEDLDAAKWSPTLRLSGIVLSGEPVVDQYEGKSGAVWRISKRTNESQIPNNVCVPLNKLINISDKLDNHGMLHWETPPGEWTIVRVGHTSTGQTNATGGGGKGLECDKFNPVAIQLQFNSWFGEIVKQAGPELSKEVLKIFHIDSWECGSQNWSPVFRDEFKKRRGYDILDYLPVMAGIALESADFSEKVLYDVRETIAELVNDVFYKQMAKLAHEKGCRFSAESVAPTMVSDGLLHYSNVDLPMGEFWLNSPTHDKPNDMLDALSAAHIYGKHIVQAEAFTTLRMNWGEHPGLLKTLQDYNYTLGVNKLVYHVFMHNPWMDRKPGMTLDPIGLYFQRDQTWWKQGKAWVDYAARCQSLLQQGNPIADIAVFTGEEVPRRAILPDRLVNVLPGLFGSEIVKADAERLANKGVPTKTYSLEVKASANIIDPQVWVNALHGYHYDSFNPDALLRLARVENGNVVFADGTSYKMLVIPGASRMSPDSGMMSKAVAEKLLQLIKDGATILIHDSLYQWPGVMTYENHDLQTNILFSQLNLAKASSILTKDGALLKIANVGKGRIIYGAYTAATLQPIALAKDFDAVDSNSGSSVTGIGFTHRLTEDADIYFISNQLDKERIIDAGFRCVGKVPELWDAVSGEVMDAKEWRMKDGITILPIRLEANGSLFVVFKKVAKATQQSNGKNWIETKPVQQLENWQLQFDTAYGGPVEKLQLQTLRDWTSYTDEHIKYYSGSANYSKSINWKRDTTSKTAWLNLGEVANIATVYVNGINCGTVWTKPYKVNMAGALKNGVNNIRIEVTNTWANRIQGDQLLPEDKRVTWTTAPYKLKDLPLHAAGLLGPVTIEREY